MKITNSKKLLNKFNRKKNFSSMFRSILFLTNTGAHQIPNQCVSLACFFAMLLAIDRSLTGLYWRRIGSWNPGWTKVAYSQKQGTRSGSKQVATQGRKKHWPGKVFKSVIFPAISLSWCVASGLTGPLGFGEHGLEEGLSLSSPPYLGSPSTPRERFMVRIK